MIATTAFAEAGTLVGDGGQWKVRQVASGFRPDNIQEAELALSGYEIVGERSIAVARVDFGDGGNFDGDQMWPAQGEGIDDFAVEVTGQIEVTTPGDITFGVRADDRAQLWIDGEVVIPEGAVAVDAFGTVNLAAGTYDVRAVAFEETGSDYLELFVAQELGTFTAFADASFELLDSVSDQSPAAISAAPTSFPANALAGAVVANLEAAGGPGGEHRFELVYPLDPASPLLLLQRGSTGWRYLDDGSAPSGDDWKGGAPFDDSAWGQAGQSPIGYGDPDVVTSIESGPADDRHEAAYFRQDFAVPIGELERIDSVLLRLRRDDGAAVYINGVEVVRDNLPNGALDNTTFAAPTAGGVNETTYFEFPVDRGLLVEGVNTLAVEVHQAALTSSDLILDVEIEYNRRSVLTGDEQYFEISGNQLLLRQDAPALPAGPFDVGVRATNACGASTERAVAVGRGAAAVAGPSAVTLDNASVLEGLSAGTLVGTLDATDGDVAEAHAFAFAGSQLFVDNNLFRISGDRLYTAEVFDASVRDSYTLRVSAVSSTGTTTSSTLTVSVDRTPPRIIPSPATVPENAAPFTAAAELSTVDPVADQHDYRLVVPLDPVPVPLIGFGATWSYLDDGSDQGTGWSSPAFDDDAWGSGPAPLGYGERGSAAAGLESPATGLGFGPDDQNKFATAYFRTGFDIVDPTLVEELVFDMELDDGAIVYLNGQQVFRVRAADVVYFDEYTGANDGGETTNDVVALRAPFPEILVAGENVLAVEVHQSNGTSSDLWLDLALTATLRQVTGTAADHFYMVGNQLRANKEIGEIPAADGDTLTVPVESVSELGVVIVEDVAIAVGPAAASNSPTDIALSNASVNEGLAPGAVVGMLSGSDPDGGALVFRLDPDPSAPGNNQFAVAGGQLVTLASLDFDNGSPVEVRVTVTDSTGNRFAETFPISIGQVLEAPTAIALEPAPAEFPIDADVGTAVGTLSTTDPNGAESHSYSFGTWPGVPGDPVLPFGSTWRYLDDGSDQGTAWISAGYDDSFWESGAAELGYGDGDEATVVDFIDTDPLTDGDQKNATTYFRAMLPLLIADGEFVFRLRYDDAAAVYINGTEVFRTTNLAAGALFDTFASANGDTVTGPLPVPAGVLVQGFNTIAVEIHQSSATSSDISFDFELAPLVASPYPAYFEIQGDEIRTRVDFTTVGLTPPFDFEIPVVSEDPAGLTFEDFVTVTMVGGQLDTDSDGLLDQWEIDNFGDLSQDGTGDPDADGQDNSNEYGADTDPNDPGDFLQIAGVTLDDADGATVTWPAKAGRTYALYRSDDLAQGGWTLLQGGLTTAVDGDLSAIDPSAPVAGDRFYRVEAMAPPIE